MVDTDTTHSEAPKAAIPSIAQMARGSKENLMAISFSQRPKTPMRTYVVSGLLMSALGISLGFGIYLMFNPDHSEYSASLEGTPSVETDQVLISGLKKVVPMHNRKSGHHPTFGSPRALDFTPATHAPISNNVPAPLSNNVPPPLVNQNPLTPVQQFVPITPHTNQYPAGAAGAAVPMSQARVQMPISQPILDPPHAITATTFASMPGHNNQGYVPLSDSHGFRAGRDSRLQMVTNR
ncbi:MAG: hypothetical protein K2Y39_02040 [Candidatus Obscuribacterales bacterium]|nr:hypothetical protein [Candidatus Obscuribacterales bacterium]